MKSLCPNLVSQNDAFPNKECCNQLSPKAKKSPTIFSLTLLSSSYLYHFLSPVPLFQSDPSSIVPSFSSVLAAAIEGLQGSGGLKVSLEQSPPNAEHCTRLSSTVINPLPPPPATLGSFSSRTNIPLACHVER